MGRIAPFGIQADDSVVLSTENETSIPPKLNPPPSFPEAPGPSKMDVIPGSLSGPPDICRRNIWTDRLTGAVEEERQNTALELAKRYVECGLTVEEVEFILTDFARRCNPPMEQNEIRQIISNTSPSKAQPFPDTIPWPDAVRVDEVLNEIVSFIRRFAIIPQYADIAIALWILHVWCLDAFTISPLLRIKSPTKSCGKTTLLNLIGQLLPKNAFSSNFTTPVMFRLVDSFKVSLCIDEVDSNFRRNEELVSLVNSGYRREGAIAYRCSGDSNEPTAYNSWSGKALAGIGRLPETTESRAIQILMRKKKKDEKVEKIRKHHSKDFEILKQKCRKNAFDNVNRLRDYEPEIPQELDDRQADNWEPLIAVADLAGGKWPAWGRQAAIALSCAGKGDEIGKGEELLADLKEIFDRMNQQGHPNLLTEWIISGLCGKSERPWREYDYGKPITPKQLANLLKPFEIEPRSVRVTTGVYRGYYGADLQDAFERYL